ncbi:MAG: hypothetical protein ACTSX8_05575 [Alphaproteobacteria bacterium]
MSAAGILAGMWPKLRRFLLRIGQWLLDVVLEEGRRGLASYLRQRVRVLSRRRKRRKKSSARYKWLTLRINIWRRCAKWLEGDEGKKLSRRVAKAAQRRAKEELDQAEPVWENFESWTKAQERRAKRRANRMLRRARRAAA